MPPEQGTQRDTLRELFGAQPILRARDLRQAGVAPQTIARAVEDGEIERISRGLYQYADADNDADQALAEIAKKIPKGVIAMLSALLPPAARRSRCSTHGPRRLRWSSTMLSVCGKQNGN